MSLKFSIFLLLFLLSVTTAAKTVFRCVQCTDCFANDYPLLPCPEGVVGCVTARIARDTIVRDCFTEKYQRTCSPLHLANRTCYYCANAHGCNMKEQDPLVCRSCDWTLDGICNNTVVCRSPFRTETPQCYILYRKTMGFHFGCLEETTPAIEYLMGEDMFRITYDLCDGNECNSHPSNFWKGWERLMDPFRVCEVCHGEHCGIKSCPPDDIYSNFCIRVYGQGDPSKADSNCLSNIRHLLPALMYAGSEYICNEDRCNARQRRIDSLVYTCGFVDYFQNVYRPQDRCASYWMPNGTVFLIGRLSNNRCTDQLRCTICNTDRCTEMDMKVRAVNFCYNVTGEPAALYIRGEQTSYMAHCGAEGQPTCFTAVNAEGVISRGCLSMRDPQFDKGETCDGYLCNRLQIAGIYCYTCQATDPNCVFSQHEGPFVACQPPVKGCYTKILGDSSVERGCAITTTLNTTINDGSIYIFCNETNVCNRHSTIKHSCHYYQLNVDLKPNRRIKSDLWRAPTNQGWLFETCPDIEGLPACYVHTSYMKINFGCVKDLNNYQLVNYHRGDLIDLLNLCDGHYCNYLPYV